MTFLLDSDMIPPLKQRLARERGTAVWENEAACCSDSAAGLP
jgi:hypothetical protein